MTGIYLTERKVPDHFWNVVMIFMILKGLKCQDKWPAYSSFSFLMSYQDQGDIFSNAHYGEKQIKYKLVCFIKISLFYYSYFFILKKRVWDFLLDSFFFFFFFFFFGFLYIYQTLHVHHALLSNHCLKVDYFFIFFYMSIHICPFYYTAPFLLYIRCEYSCHLYIEMTQDSKEINIYIAFILTQLMYQHALGGFFSKLIRDLEHCHY
jgi:hypothetical protein